MERPEKEPGRRRALRLLGTGFIVLLVLVGLHGPILTGVASFMVIRDPLERADLLVPLYQGEAVPVAAAVLYRRGYADRVALGRTRPRRLEALGLIPPPHEIWRKLLEAEGVPSEAITTIGFQIGNDVELAQAVAASLRGLGKSRVIVVASEPLSRIARHDFRRGLAAARVEVLMYPVPPSEFHAATWWRSRHGCVTYFDAYLLLAFRLVRD